ncbi:MAG: 5-carboxymethyl-2-hydroxymuconate isomerase [Gammaproteobacteria bacterium]|nr:MAG: 5-carboxymethyl-2-hydroxymuconate isomerase [Gammaproteobacteria bacterium]
MPHCIIEYSQKLENEVRPVKLMSAVLQGALNSNLFEADDIKTRIIPFQHHLTGGTKQNFIHVTLKISSGRSINQRLDLSKSVLSELTQRLWTKSP